MRARTLLALAGAGLAVALAGCAGAAPPPPTPSPTSTPRPTIAPGVEAVPTAAPALHPDGSAEQNKLYWDATIERYWQSFGLGSTQTMIDHLVGAGFAPTTIEVTYDSTAIGLGVDSIEVSTRFGEDCLLAVVRGERFATVIAPVLGTGRCLVGDQVPVG